MAVYKPFAAFDSVCESAVTASGLFSGGMAVTDMLATAGSRTTADVTAQMDSRLPMMGTLVLGFGKVALLGCDE